MIRLSLSSVALLLLAAAPLSAQDAPRPKPVAMKPGDTLSGQLTAMRIRGKKKGQRLVTFQLVSVPRRLPLPGGLCNLETGPETFQIVADEAQSAQLKRYLGKDISLRVDEVACAEAAGVMSEAIVSKWRLPN